MLRCETSSRWVDVAVDNLNIIVTDHANCERKAALTALSLVRRYPQEYKLVQKMSRLAREELGHMEKVLRIMHKHKVPFQKVSPSRYASMLNVPCRKNGVGRLIDLLIVGAYIEARSCERFIKLIPELDRYPDLQKLYSGLVNSEGRHFKAYIDLAQYYSKTDITSRVHSFGNLEAKLVQDYDTEIRFHSGYPSGF